MWMTEIVTRFPMGTDVPEWLITVEPMGPQARKGNFRFAVDVDVVETADNFIVVPAVYGPFAHVIDSSGTVGCKMFAPGKVTRLVNMMTDLFAEGRAPLVALDAPMQAPEIHRPVTIYEDPHRTFWQRVVYAFTGR